MISFFDFLQEDKRIERHEYWWTGTTTKRAERDKIQYFDKREIISFIREKSVTTVKNPFFLTKNPEYALEYAKSHLTNDVKENSNYVPLVFCISMAEPTNVFNVNHPGDFDKVFGNDPVNVFLSEIFSRCEPYFAWNSTMMGSKMNFRPLEYVFARLFILYKNNIDFIKKTSKNSKLTNADILPEIRVAPEYNILRLLCDDNINLNLKFKLSELDAIIEKYDIQVFGDNIKTDASGNRIKKDGRYVMHRAKDFADNPAYSKLNPDAIVHPLKDYRHYTKTKNGKAGTSATQSRRNINSELMVPTDPDELKKFENRVNAYLNLFQKFHKDILSKKSEDKDFKNSPTWDFIEKKLNLPFIKTTKDEKQARYAAQNTTTYDEDFVGDPIDLLQYWLYDKIAQQGFDGIYAPEVQGAKSMNIKSADSTVAFFNNKFLGTASLLPVDLSAQTDLSAQADLSASTDSKNGRENPNANVFNVEVFSDIDELQRVIDQNKQNVLKDKASKAAKDDPPTWDNYEYSDYDAVSIKQFKKNAEQTQQQDKAEKRWQKIKARQENAKRQRLEREQFEDPKNIWFDVKTKKPVPMYIDAFNKLKAVFNSPILRPSIAASGLVFSVPLANQILRFNKNGIKNSYFNDGLIPGMKSGGSVFGVYVNAPGTPSRTYPKIHGIFASNGVDAIKFYKELYNVTYNEEKNLAAFVIRDETPHNIRKILTGQD